LFLRPYGKFIEILPRKCGNTAELLASSLSLISGPDGSAMAVSSTAQSRFNNYI